MAEYRRIVSYLYKYTNGQKGENAGFVRVETRPDGIRLFFHVKDMRMMDERKIKAYFYFHEGEKKKGIFVDEFFCSRGFCEYKKVIPETAVHGFRELMDMDGMVFYDHNGLLYGTCWDDREITAENIELSDAAASEQKKKGENADDADHVKEETGENAGSAERAKDEAGENAGGAERAKEEIGENTDDMNRARESESIEPPGNAENTEATENMGDERNRKTEEPQEISENIGAEEETETDESAVTGVDVEIGPEAASAPAIHNEGMDEILEANEAKAQPFSSKNCPDGATGQKEMGSGLERKKSRPPKNNPATPMEQMLFEYPTVPIQWDANLIQAVRIELQDISRLPTRNWRYAENGFLLQGYEIHHYLLLGRIQMRPEQYLWVLGVPGVYHNREKYLAEIFGFYDYIPMEQGKLKTGGFGFWIASLANG